MNLADIKRITLSKIIKRVKSFAYPDKEILRSLGSKSNSNRINYYRSLSLKSVSFKIEGSNNQIDIKQGCNLEGVIFDIHGDNNNIHIEENCLFGRIKSQGYGIKQTGLVFNIKGSNHNIHIGKSCRFSRGGLIWFADHGGQLSIGAGSTFEDATIAVTEPGSKVQIGTECMFAYDIDVRTGDSHSVLDINTNERINYAQDIIIGNQVWVAAHSTLLKGVKIMDNSIVGTGAVVTKGFDVGGVVIAGNPAKIVKSGITWSRKRFYKESATNTVE